MQIKHTHPFFFPLSGGKSFAYAKMLKEVCHYMQYFCSAGILKNYIFNVAADPVGWFA